MVEVFFYAEALRNDILGTSREVAGALGAGGGVRGTQRHSPVRAGTVVHTKDTVMLLCAKHFSKIGASSR